MNLEDTHKPKHFCFPKTQSLTNVNISPSNLGRLLYPIQKLVDYIVKKHLKSIDMNSTERERDRYTTIKGFLL